MGSYEIIEKTEAIREKVIEGDLLSAQEILETINLRKVKNLSDLNLMAGVLKENGYYDEAAELYLRIYEKSQTRKTISQLIDISIRRDETEEAEKYYKIYEKYAEEDYENHIFRYKLDKMQGASYEKMIRNLEKLKMLQYTEKWAYELAKLYYKAGMEKECIKECSDIILWFGEGPYVEKAKLLRSYFMGDTNKEKLMEEIRRRSLGISGNTIDFQVAKERYMEQMAALKDDTLDLAQIIKEANEKKEEKTSQNDLLEEVAITLDAELMKEETSESDSVKEEVDYNNIDAIADKEKESTSITELTEEEEQVFVFDLEDEVEEEVAQEDNILDYIASTTGVDLEEVFQGFLEDEVLKLQLVDILVNLIQKNIYPPMIYIAGNNEEMSVELSKKLALFMNKAGLLSSPKVAKISAQKLNAINIMGKKETLRGCCLLINGAEALYQESVQAVTQLAQQLEEDFAVILIGNEMDSETFSQSNTLFGDSEVWGISL